MVKLSNDIKEALLDLYRETKRYLKERGLAMRWVDKRFEFYYIDGNMLDDEERYKLWDELDNYHRRSRYQSYNVNEDTPFDILIL